MALVDDINAVIAEGLAPRTVTVESVPAIMIAYFDDNWWINAGLDLAVGDEVELGAAELVVFSGQKEVYDAIQTGLLRRPVGRNHRV